MVLFSCSGCVAEYLSGVLQEAAGLLRDLATLHPEICTLDDALLRELAERARACLRSLAPRDRAELVSALAPMLYGDGASGSVPRSAGPAVSEDTTGAAFSASSRKGEGKAHIVLQLNYELLVG
jgi:hypothetical protein